MNSKQKNKHKHNNNSAMKFKHQQYNTYYKAIVFYNKTRRYQTFILKNKAISRSLSRKVEIFHEHFLLIIELKKKKKKNKIVENNIQIFNYPLNKKYECQWRMQDCFVGRGGISSYWDKFKK